ncbi:hypothetical protein EBQ74_11075 [bacterium]|nr:hypothetical protein [bacterium]
MLDLKKERSMKRIQVGLSIIVLTLALISSSSFAENHSDAPSSVLRKRQGNAQQKPTHSLNEKLILSRNISFYQRLPSPRNTQKNYPLRLKKP